MLAALCAHAALGAMVTINVSTKSGAAAEDTLIVFDPLDAQVPSSRDTAVIDQVNKRFTPRISVVRTGTAVVFPNSDRIRHQVYSFSKPKMFTLKLYAGSPTTTSITFDHAGLVILGCNIHDNMVAFVGVVDSPYFVKMGSTGSGALDLPAGRYRMRVWHPNLTAGVPPREITVAAPSLTIPVSTEMDAASLNVAAWPE